MSYTLIIITEEAITLHIQLYIYVHSVSNEEQYEKSISAINPVATEIQMVLVIASIGKP